MGLSNLVAWERLPLPAFEPVPEVTLGESVAELHGDFKQRAAALEDSVSQLYSEVRGEPEKISPHSYKRLVSSTATMKNWLDAVDFYSLWNEAVEAYDAEQESHQPIRDRNYTVLQEARREIEALETRAKLIRGSSLVLGIGALVAGYATERLGLGMAFGAASVVLYFSAHHGTLVQKAQLRKLNEQAAKYGGLLV